MQSTSVTVKVPASTANLGPGFDTIGMAFQLYTTIQMRFSTETQIQLIGENVTGLPQDKSNLLYSVAAKLFQRAGQLAPELAINVSSDIPLTRGLGSSAAAIVGAFVAANKLAGEPFSKEEIFTMATHLEGHPDNVGASLFGGIVIATMPDREEGLVPYVRIPVPSALKVLVVVPDFRLSTEDARSVLPTSYSRADVVYNVGHSSLLTAALAGGRLDLLGKAMQDRIHQPYRAELVPGLTELLRNASNHGALGAALSGAGPTILCFYQSEEDRESLASYIETVMMTHKINYEILSLQPDKLGVQLQVEQIEVHQS